MSTAAMERRVAPRFTVRCTGELAACNGVTDVVISDMSVTGCGVEIAGDWVDARGRTGVLSIHADDRSSAPVMLPVVISNHRLEGGKARWGLQFRRLTIGQMRSLIGVLDGIIEK